MDIKNLIKQSSQKLQVERNQTVQQKKQKRINEQRERELQAHLLDENVAKFKNAYKKYNQLNTNLTELCSKLLVIYDYAGTPVPDKYLGQVGDILGRMKHYLDVLIELEGYSLGALGMNRGASFCPWILREAQMLSIYINMHDLAGGGEKFFALMSDMVSEAEE